MFVHVNAQGEVSLESRDDFRGFELRVAADDATWSLTLEDVADLDSDASYAWVHEDWLLTRLMRDPPTSDWRSRFDAMLLYARDRGWMREAPVRSVRAHVRKV